MKKRFFPKTFWLSLRSAGVLIFFYLIAVATDPYAFMFEANTVATSEDLGDGRRKNTYTLDESEVKTYTGRQDTQGRWDGPVTHEEGRYSETNPPKLIPVYTSQIHYVEGIRHGKTTTTWHHYGAGEPEEECYEMGKRIDCQPSAKSVTADGSAFQIFEYKYPWYMRYFQVFGFDESFMQAYVDTLEEIIFSFGYPDPDFNDCYQNAVDSLSGTEYDTISTVNSILFLLEGIEEMKNDEFRMAVIDNSRSEGSSFHMIQSKYPGYLTYMNDMEVSDQDFELFCGKFDSIMNSYDPLDRDDIFFVDSVETRMYRALQILGSIEEDTATSGSSLKSAISIAVSHSIFTKLNHVRTTLAQETEQATLSEIAETIYYSFLMHLINADKMMLALQESYYNRYEIVRFPTITTQFLRTDGTASAYVEGYIHDDGGANIIESGIAWATYYNPTTHDLIETSGATKGSFSVTLDGLEQGTTYFARSYATNSAGTAYGNCVTFSLGSAVNVADLKKDHGFVLFPNPASSSVTFRFQVESAENLMLTIVDMNSKTIYQDDLKHMHKGINRIELDVSHLNNGIYFCHLTQGGEPTAKQKLVISH